MAFGLFYADKNYAQNGLWRISEQTLFLSAVLGGSIGAILGMELCHHKTKKPRFYIGLPAVLAAQFALWVLILAMLRSMGR